jgi:hypothetical protein
MIYAIGSVFGSSEEKLSDFISQNVACIGWPRDEAPALHQILQKMVVGDIIFVKAFPPSSGLHVKAVGIITSSEIFNVPNLGYGRAVQWVWSATEGRVHFTIGRLNDRYDNMRNGTLYEEFGPEVQTRIIDILLNPVAY